VVNGMQYALLGVAFALVFGVTGRFHFAFAFVYAATAYAASLLQEAWSGQVWLPLLLALLIGAVLGALCEIVVYRPVVRGSTGGSLLTVFVGALGLTIVGTNLISLLFGSGSRGLVQLGSTTHVLGQASISDLELGATLLAVALVLGLAALLRWTPVGRTIRAVRSNPALATIMDLKVERVYVLVFAIGSVLAGVAALVAGIRFAVTPDMGTRPVLFAFVVAFLGGTARSPIVVGAAGLALGLVESLSRIWLTSQWSALVVFVVLFGYLCLPNTSLRGLLRRGVRTPRTGAALPAGGA